MPNISHTKFCLVPLSEVFKTPPSDNISHEYSSARQSSYRAHKPRGVSADSIKCKDGLASAHLHTPPGSSMEEVSGQPEPAGESKTWVSTESQSLWHGRRKRHEGEREVSLCVLFCPAPLNHAALVTPLFQQRKSLGIVHMPLLKCWSLGTWSTTWLHLLKQGTELDTHRPSTALIWPKSQ